MEGVDHNNRGVFGHTIIFIGCTVIAATMLMMAATLLLAQWLESLIAALAILGGVFAVIALALYWGSVRPTLRQLRSEIELISKIAHLIHCSYNWLSTKLSTLINQLL